MPRAGVRVAAAAFTAILLSLLVGWSVASNTGVVGASRTFLQALVCGFVGALLLPPRRQSPAGAFGSAAVVLASTLGLVAAIQILEGEGGAWVAALNRLARQAWWVAAPLGVVYWAASRLAEPAKLVNSFRVAPRARSERVALGLWWCISLGASIYLPIVLVLHLLEYGYGWQWSPEDALRVVVGIVGMVVLAAGALALGGLLPGTER